MRPIALALLILLAASPVAHAQVGLGVGGIPVPGGTRPTADALAGAASGFRQVAVAWRANDAKRAYAALELARRWLAVVPRPEVQALDERAAHLQDSMAMRALDVPGAAEILARDALLIAGRYGGATIVPWPEPLTPTPTPAPVLQMAPQGAPGAPVRRPPGMGHT